ncbi:MAG: nitrilase family protein [Tannerellaceae bacterium]|jgi:predicted amidohydrolase|nr:nitrilase family protein [Tannerellaceae bacterium]
MKAQLRISLVQTAIRWGNKPANLAACARLLRRLSGETDLVVLPETFSTGFMMDTHTHGEATDGESVRTLRTWAERFGFAVAGSFISRSGRYYYNRGFFITPAGAEHYCDKRHLFSPAGEDRRYAAGRSTAIVRYMGWNIRLIVCYDLRFPVWSRNAGNAYDLLICPANWPAVRQRAWQTLLPARAVENQAYVCGVNCVAVDHRDNVYAGGSAMYSPLGEKLADCGSKANAVRNLTIDRDELTAFRSKFPFWKDSDKFNIKR